MSKQKSHYNRSSFDMAVAALVKVVDDIAESPSFYRGHEVWKDLLEQTDTRATSQLSFNAPQGTVIENGRFRFIKPPPTVMMKTHI